MLAKIPLERCMAKIDIQPLQADLPFGVRISGVDHTALEDAGIRGQISDAFATHGMIVFENVEPSSALQVAISNVFGPLKEHPAAGLTRVDGENWPGVIEMRNHPNSGGIVEVGGKQLSHWLPWHFDHCYNNELNRAGVLRATEIVPEGGITGFADGVALYEAFPKELLAKLMDAMILYTLDVQYDTMRFGRPHDLNVIQRKPATPEFEASARAMPRALHPAVWTRNSGEKVLHISPWMAVGISGAEDAAGDALLEAVCQELRRHADACSYHHAWQPTDMVIWDNWRMLHSVSGHDPAYGRSMVRTTIKGDYGLGRFEGDGVGGKILEMTV
jgi:taurine dioxygenase